MAVSHVGPMIQVTDEDAERTYYFSCNKWLGLGIGDNILERTLVAVEEDPRGGQTEYRVRRGSWRWRRTPGGDRPSTG